MKPQIIVICILSLLLSMMCLKALAVRTQNAATDSANYSAADPAVWQVNSQIDAYFDDCFRWSPEWATSLGLHQYDSLISDFSSQAIASRSAALKDHLSRFQAVDKRTLPEQLQIDLDLIISHIRAQLLDLEGIKSWKSNPDKYSSYANEAIYCLLSRDFAPMNLRLKHVIAREKQIRSILEQGKENVVNPPRIFTEIALEQLPGIIDYFEKSVPEKVSSATDQELIAEFTDANKDVVSALREYQTHLQDVVLSRSFGEFAIGASNYKDKLLYEESVDTPLDQLLCAGEHELKRLQEAFVKTAAQINPSKDPLTVFKDISAEHPSPDKLLESVDGVLGSLRAMCVDRGIVTIPFDDRLKVAEMPPSMRALAFAAMDTPGPFEPAARESYYYVTLPEASWSAERTEAHMRSFCTYNLLNTSVHEAFPGHFVQGLWDRKAPSKTRKILGCGSNVEGWAHYCEEMMVEEGLANGNPKLRLVQIHDALLRACRYIAGIKMHTQNMTLEQATDLFVEQGFQEKSNSLREAKRGTMDPTYLVYTLGKLQILSLKEEYKKAKGEHYSLKQFHDEFLAQGSPPIAIVRKIMLGTGSGAKLNIHNHRT